MKREHELKAAQDQSKVAQVPDKTKHSALEIAQKWAMIRVMRDLDVDRLTARKGGKIVTQQDWMIAALLALNTEAKPVADVMNTTK